MWISFYVKINYKNTKIQKLIKNYIINNKIRYEEIIGNCLIPGGRSGPTKVRLNSFEKSVKEEAEFKVYFSNET